MSLTHKFFQGFIYLYIFYSHRIVQNIRPCWLARLGQTLGDSDLQLTSFLLRLRPGRDCADLAGAVCLTDSTQISEIDTTLSDTRGVLHQGSVHLEQGHIHDNCLISRMYI